jgi:hypothetical protein
MRKPIKFIAFALAVALAAGVTDMACTSFDDATIGVNPGVSDAGAEGGTKPSQHFLSIEDAARFCSNAFRCPYLGPSTQLSVAVPVDSQNYSSCVEWLGGPLPSDRVGVAQAATYLACAAAATSCKEATACMYYEVIGPDDPSCARTPGNAGAGGTGNGGAGAGGTNNGGASNGGAGAAGTGGGAGQGGAGQGGAGQGGAGQGGAGQGGAGQGGAGQGGAGQGGAAAGAAGQGGDAGASGADATDFCTDSGRTRVECGKAITHCDSRHFPEGSSCLQGANGLSCALGTDCSVVAQQCQNGYARFCGSSSKLAKGYDCTAGGYTCGPTTDGVDCLTDGVVQACDYESSSSPVCLNNNVAVCDGDFVSTYHCDSAAGATCEGLSMPRCRRQGSECSSDDTESNKCAGSTISLCIDGERRAFDCATIGKQCTPGQGGRTASCQ